MVKALMQPLKGLETLNIPMEHLTEDHLIRLRSNLAILNTLMAIGKDLDYWMTVASKEKTMPNLQQ